MPDRTAHRFREWPAVWYELAAAEYRDRSRLGRLTYPLWLVGAALSWAVAVPITVAGWSVWTVVE